jgi:hypothetical protein
MRFFWNGRWSKMGLSTDWNHKKFTSFAPKPGTSLRNRSHGQSWEIMRHMPQLDTQDCERENPTGRDLRIWVVYAVIWRSRGSSEGESSLDIARSKFVEGLFYNLFLVYAASCGGFFYRKLMTTKRMLSFWKETHEVMYFASSQRPNSADDFLKVWPGIQKFFGLPRPSHG